MQLSALDLITLTKGQSTKDAFENTIELAKHLDELGYKRLWFAEHHGTDSALSSAPEITAAFIAGETERISVGTGGTMVMHYSPLKIAETFKTLSALAPGRVNIGLGRAPGGSRLAIEALSEGRDFQPTDLYSKIDTILNYLSESEQSNPIYKRIKASPTGLDQVATPYLLGSSGNSAMKAGEKGIGYSFAKFFGVDGVPEDILDAYRANFKPSDFLDEPHVISTYLVAVAETEEEAKEIALPIEISRYLQLHGQFDPIMTIDQAKDFNIEPFAQSVIDKEHQKRNIVVGTAEQVKEILLDEQEKWGFDEIMVYTPIPDHKKRLKSYQLLMDIMK